MRAIRALPAPVRAVALAALSLAAAPGFSGDREAAAANPVVRVWTGAGANSNWSTDANWNSAAPQAGDAIWFPANAARKTNVNDLPGFTSFSQVVLLGGGYSVSGNAIVVTDEVRNTADGVNTLSLAIDGPGELHLTKGRLNLLGANSHDGPNYVGGGTLHAGNASAFGDPDALLDIFDGEATIADGLNIPNPLIIGGPSSPVIRALGDATWSGGITLADSTEFSAAPGGTLTLASSLTGPAGFVKTGAGTLRLTEAGTYEEETRIEQGTLRVEHGDALGGQSAGTTVETGGTLLVASPIQAEPITLNGTGAFGLGALRSEGGLIIIGSVAAASGATIRVDAGTMRLAAGLDGGSADIDITKTGAGTLEIVGHGSFGGTLRVDAGDLSVRGALEGEVLVNGGRLTGDGTIASLVAESGVVEPGVAGAGVLVVLGDASLYPDATLRFTIDSAQSSTSMRVSGSFVPAGAVLELVGDGADAPGSITLVENLGPGPILYLFADVFNNDVITLNGKQFRVDYGGGPLPSNDFVLRALAGAPTLETHLLAVPLLRTAPSGGDVIVRFLASNGGVSAAHGLQLTFSIYKGGAFAAFDAPDGWDCLQPPVGSEHSLVSCQRAAWPSSVPGVFEEFLFAVTVVGPPGAELEVGGFLEHDAIEGNIGDNIPIVTLPISAADPLPYKLRVPVAARD